MVELADGLMEAIRSYCSKEGITGGSGRAKISMSVPPIGG
jgi:hypothetical protein